MNDNFSLAKAIYISLCRFQLRDQFNLYQYRDTFRPTNVFNGPIHIQTIWDYTIDNPQITNFRVVYGSIPKEACIALACNCADTNTCSVGLAFQ